MTAFIKPLAVAAILTGAFLSAPALAAPSCATTIGMTITPPAGTERSADAGQCMNITGGFNWAYSGYTTDEQDQFKSLLADRWGGTAADWFYLNETSGRSDNISAGNFPRISASFDTWTNMEIFPVTTEPTPTGGRSVLSGTFTVSITEDTSVPTPFAERRLDIVGVMKPDDTLNPGNPGARDGSYVDAVFAYLFSDIVIKQRGEMTGTFDFRSTPGSAASTYAYGGNLGLFGRIVSSVDPTPIPEPGILALIGVAAAGASMARRKRLL